MSTHEQNPGNQKHSINPNDLPPLDQTAEVPAKHRDDIHQQFGNLAESYARETAKVPRKNRDKLNWYEKTSVRLGGAVAGLVAVGGVALGLSGGEDKEVPTKPETSVSQIDRTNDSSSSQDTKQDSTEITHGNFSLRAEKYYPQNPGEIIVDFVNTFNEWQNTGYSKEAASAEARFTMSDEEYASKLNKASDQAIADNLLVDNWKENPNLVDWYETSVRVHNTTTVLALKTSEGENQDDIEHHMRFIDLDVESVIVNSSSEDKIVISGVWSGRDNSDKNRADDLNPGIDPNGEVGGYTLTFIKDSHGNMRLADEQPYSN